MEKIREGLDLVLGKRLNAIAYIPLRVFSERIMGKPDYKIKELKEITEYKPEEEFARNKVQENWFWEILGEF